MYIYANMGDTDVSICIYFMYYLYYLLYVSTFSWNFLVLLYNFKIVEFGLKTTYLKVKL